MTTFKGAGAGTGNWTRRRYLPDGTVLEGDEQAPAKKRLPALHTRFHPHVNHALTKEDAEAIGAQRTPDMGTYIQSERQLNAYLAREREHGREAHWKQH